MVLIARSDQSNASSVARLFAAKYSNVSWLIKDIDFTDVDCLFSCTCASFVKFKYSIANILPPFNPSWIEVK